MVMETGIDNLLVSDFVGALRWTMDSPGTQMPGGSGCAAVESDSAALSGIRCVRDPGDSAPSRPDPDGEAGRAEVSGICLRALCHPANSGADAAHLE